METQTPDSEDSFLKRLIFIFVFFTVTPITLLASVISLVAIANSERNIPKQEATNILSYETGVQLYASLPSDFPSVSGEIVEEDARPEIIRKLLAKNNSPLEPYSELLVTTSDKYGLDWRLLVAIAQKESGLCRVIPEGSHNCWGWGIHSQGTLGFESFEEGIETVAKGLKENYIDQGYVSVEEIMTKYAHPSSTTWAEGVLYYMRQLE